jgi:2-polyprenyl-6-methoxyphenol hydroxylase-like FAD-dependent oxidoreductase
VIAADGMQSIGKATLSGISATATVHAPIRSRVWLRQASSRIAERRAVVFGLDGHLALLPLPDRAVGQTAAVSMVWSVSEARADELCALVRGTRRKYASYVTAATRRVSTAPP